MDSTLFHIFKRLFRAFFLYIRRFMSYLFHEQILFSSDSNSQIARRCHTQLNNQSSIAYLGCGYLELKSPVIWSIILKLRVSINSRITRNAQVYSMAVWLAADGIFLATESRDLGLPSLVHSPTNNLTRMLRTFRRYSIASSPSMFQMLFTSFIRQWHIEVADVQQNPSFSDSNSFHPPIPHPSAPRSINIEFIHVTIHRNRIHPSISTCPVQQTSTGVYGFAVYTSHEVCQSSSFSNFQSFLILCQSIACISHLASTQFHSDPGSLDTRHLVMNYRLDSPSSHVLEGSRISRDVQDLISASQSLLSRPCSQDSWVTVIFEYPQILETPSLFTF